MKWAEVSIKTTHEATELIAEMFHDLGASGVVIEDPELLQTYLTSGTWDYTDLTAPVDREVVTVKAYLPVDETLDEKLRLFEEAVDLLPEHNIDKGSAAISWNEVQDEDWENNWKEYYHTEKIGDRIVIKPSWEEYQAGREDVVVELDPGMAFGTGTHPTTSMCVKALEELVAKDAVVFDVGTGSGILAIAAAKLGAAKVQAVDFDPLAVRIAGENVEKNNVTNLVETKQSDLLQNTTGQADVIIANIVADIIIRLLDQIPEKLHADGVLLASGIIKDRIGDVTKAVFDHGLLLDRVMEEGGWAAMLIRRGEKTA